MKSFAVVLTLVLCMSAGAQTVFKNSSIVSVAWDIQNNGQWMPGSGLGTVLDSGEMISDGGTMKPIVNALNYTSYAAGCHGSWRLNTQDKTVRVQSLCAESTGTFMIVVQAVLTAMPNGVFRGQAIVRRFASPADFRDGLTPLVTVNVGMQLDVIAVSHE